MLNSALLYGDLWAQQITQDAERMWNVRYRLDAVPFSTLTVRADAPFLHENLRVSGVTTEYSLVAKPEAYAFYEAAFQKIRINQRLFALIWLPGMLVLAMPKRVTPDRFNVDTFYLTEGPSVDQIINRANALHVAFDDTLLISRGDGPYLPFGHQETINVFDE